MKPFERSVSVLIFGAFLLTILGSGVSCEGTPKSKKTAAAQANGGKKEAPKPAAPAQPEKKKTREQMAADLRARHPSLFEDTPEDEKYREPFSDFQVTAQVDAIFEREVSLARKQMALKEYESAISHFNAALSTGKADAGALSERGYAKWLLKRVPEATEDFWSAAGENASKEIRAQIWHNLGLVFEHQKDAEMSRVAFAVSLALAPSSPTRQKLGARSTCRSNIKFGPEIADAPNAATSRGWLGVHARLGLDGEPSTEAEARDVVCHTVSAGRGGPPEGSDGVCTGSTPFAISCCSGMGGFMAREMDVVPFGDNLFFSLDHGMVGGWMRGCQGVARPDVTVVGSYALVHNDASEVFPNGDFDAKTVPAGEDGEYMGDPPCRMSPPEQRVTIYRLADAKRLLEVRSFSPTAPTVVVLEKEKEIKISGDGCDTSIPLE